MWIAFVVIGVLIAIFAVLWMLDPRDDRIASEVRRVYYWSLKYQNRLEEDDFKRLTEQGEALFELVDKKNNAGVLYFGRCCRNTIINDYETLLDTHYSVYKKSIDQTASKADAYNALFDMALKKFSMNESVYYPKLNFHGIVAALNEDDTYTICDPAERCHRVKENELVPKSYE